MSETNRIFGANAGSATRLGHNTVNRPRGNSGPAAFSEPLDWVKSPRGYAGPRVICTSEVDRIGCQRPISPAPVLSGLGASLHTYPACGHLRSGGSFLGRGLANAGSAFSNRQRRGRGGFCIDTHRSGNRLSEQRFTWTASFAPEISGARMPVGLTRRRALGQCRGVIDEQVDAQGPANLTA